MSATEGPIETEMNDTEQHATSEDVGTPGSSEVSKTNDMNGETSPVQHKKRHRTSRDTLLTSLTPELTGKRQRKVNPIYSEFALDKKTSHVLGQDEQGKTGTEPNSPVSPAPSTPQATTPTPSSQPLPSQPNSTPETPTVHVSKRELIASPNEVQERNKKLPKGYRYEPVVEAAPVIKKEEPLPQKRERKKSSYVSDFVSDIKDDKKKEKEEKYTKPKKIKKKTPTSTPTSTPIIPPFPAQTKKQHTPTPTHYGATTPTTYHYQPPFFNNNNITDVQKRKLELEAQMRFLEEQIASVNQKIELKQIELAQIEATKQPKKYIPPTPPAPIAPAPAPVVVAAPAPVPVQPTTPTPLSLPTTPTFDSMEKKGRVGRKAKRSSVYDRFDSEEDEDDEVFSVPKRKGRPPLSSGSKPGRKSRKSRFDEDSSEEEPLDADPKLKQCEALLRRLRKHGYAWPFNQPVDPIALGIPDYYTIITRPMDLGTVGKNLQAGDYGTIEEFADDCRLVFNNATTYNRPGSDIFVMAETLLKVFEEDFSKLSGLPPPPPRVYATPAPLPEDATATTAAPISVAPQPVQPSPQPVVVAPQQPPPQPLAHLSPPLVSASYKKEQKTKEVLGATIQELRDSMKYVREEIQKLRRDKGLTTPTASATPTTPAYPASTTPRQGRPGRVREEAKEMTFDEKRILSQNINNLPPENLGKVLQIIHTRMPHLAQAGSDDIEIDIDALDNATLRALDRYVKTCLTKLKKKQAAAKAAEISSQNTAKSIQDVKKKLRELQDKSHAMSGRSRRKEHDEDMEIDIDDDTPSRSYPSVLIPKDKDSSSSSDSSSESSSDSSSDSESDSSSDSEDEKPKAKPAPAPAPAVTAASPAPAVAPVPTNPPPLIPVNPTPAVEPKEPAQSTPEVPRKAPEPEPEAPKIIQAGNVKKDIELKNLDSWTKLDTFTTPAPTTATTQDATWSQFQAKEMQKKQREKELQEQEERERRERAEREAERRKQEEQRLKEIQEQEEKRRREEEQAKEEAAKNAQRELAEKRAAERRAREAESNKAISSLDQSLAMQSFEQNSVDFSQPNLPFSLKDDKDQQ